ncbi:hypothetical protein DUNSADRAFT_12025 [Dunaliella salina]|uniref:Uncharacterized protein n=1 Tax=Dunaliella salina TaxID=3046 RepID=A0ABQ7GC62_DUNSA|nr:hypothetical protein DUNSADRAFT_12025 [Dunaliella salina]|eukprot:KAF5832186.1 hypothetical protein DUNSADRAFT_12025 [Dunaliella salina]
MVTDKEQQLQERLQRRAALVCAVLRKFIHSFYRGRQEMIDEARAKELAKLASTGKKGKKKKAAAPKDEPKAGNKDKKPKKTPVQEAWQTFLADMDERINKQKRVGLEDIYRGTAQLEPQERVDLAALLATTNKKILPLASLNINQHNVRMALVSASAALSAQDAVPAKSARARGALASRGASAEQLLEQGFSVSDALRAGHPVDAAVEAGKHNLKELREAGLSVRDVLDVPGTDLKEQLEQGPWGLRRLREAGYCASELVAYGGNFANPWSLKQAGFTLMAPQWKELLKRRAAQQKGDGELPQQESSRTSLG